jgi:hypothetical protein
LIIELVTLQAVSYIMGSLGVFMAAVYYVINLRAQQSNMKTTLETRQAQLFMGVYQTYVAKELHRDIEIVLNAQSMILRTGYLNTVQRATRMGMRSLTVS